MSLLWPIIGFIVAVSLLVAVHEYGHYWAARRLGFKVLRFSVGFGPALWRRVAGADRTEYVIAALPLGGYVKLLDEREGAVDEAERARAFTRRPPWQRILVLLAGPGFNFAFAILLLWGMLWLVGSPEARAVVGRVAVDSPAARAGLRADDEILRMDGQTVSGRGDVVFGLIDAMSGDGVAQLTVRTPGGAERDLELRVDDPAQRRALTEPSALMGGLGLRFWSPPVPARIGRVLPQGPADLAGLRAGDLVTAVDGVPVADFVTSTTHKTLRGPRGGIAMCRAENAKALDRSVFPGTQGGPLMHVIAGKAVAFGEALKPEFKQYGRNVVDNARTLAAALASGGVKLVSGGTDNHLMLVDVTPLGIGGKLAEEVLDRCGITCNKNMIPFDERKPMDPSGIRLGTPALTTRGMGTSEMKQIAAWILRVLKSPSDQQVIATTKGDVAELAEQFPVPAAKLDAAVEVAGR